MQNTPAAPHVGALIDPTRPVPPPRTSVLLGPDGAVLRRTTRTAFGRGRLVRLVDGRPDPATAVEVAGGHMITMETDPAPDPEVPWGPSSAASYEVEMRELDPALVQLLTGGLVLPSGVGR